MFTIQEEDGFLVSGCFFLFCFSNQNFFIWCICWHFKVSLSHPTKKKKKYCKGKTFLSFKKQLSKGLSGPWSFSINDSAMLDAYATAVGLRCAFDTATRDSHDVTGTLIVFDAATCLGLFCQVFLLGRWHQIWMKWLKLSIWILCEVFCFLGQRFCHTGRMDVMKYSGFRTLSLSL